MTRQQFKTLSWADFLKFDSFKTEVLYAPDGYTATWCHANNRGKRVVPFHFGRVTPLLLVTLFRGARGHWKTRVKGINWKWD